MCKCNSEDEKSSQLYPRGVLIYKYNSEDEKSSQLYPIVS